MKARSPRGQSGLKMHSNSYDPDAAGSGSDSEEASLLPLSGSTGSASLRVLGFEVSYSVKFARRKLAITTTFNPVARRHAPASGARLAT